MLLLLIIFLQIIFFLSKSNVSDNKIDRNGTENNRRTLSGTIAHEVTHSLVKNRIGLLKYMQLDTWKNEGYADYIAKESSFNFLIGTYFYAIPKLLLGLLFNISNTGCM